jgi:hypothetical protein
MAVNAATAYEFRAATGSATNGGGFADLNPGTSVDYTQQAASQLSLTDCATSGIGVTTLTSATGGFTAAMEGNVMYLHTGTNLTDGWYQITGYTDTNTVTLDRAPDDGVGGVSGGDCEVGGALDILTDTFLDDTNSLVAGNTIWIKNDGTMTLTGAINATNAGTTTNPIAIEGYNSSRGDNPLGTNRPLIAAGANDFELAGNYWITKNLRFTTTTANGFNVDGIASVIFNIASNNSSGTAARSAFLGGNNAKYIGCDGQSVNGRAFRYATGIAYGSYAHDSVDGFDPLGDDICIVNCVVDTCSGNGMDVVGIDDILLANNTIYNCGTGINGTTGYGTMTLNNVIDACTTGASKSSSFGIDLFDYNCWNNTTDVSNVTKGDNSVTGDPSMTDPANGDFSIPNSSNCVDAALDAGDYTGATV